MTIQEAHDFLSSWIIVTKRTTPLDKNNQNNLLAEQLVKATSILLQEYKRLSIQETVNKVKLTDKEVTDEI
ncbi:MAG: hypothetical protein WC438_05760 [Candidatus Pacearchaeota archaeon]|jgi:hypothetical protein